MMKKYRPMSKRKARPIEDNVKRYRKFAKKRSQQTIFSLQVAVILALG